MKPNIELELKTIITKEQFYNLLKFYPNLKFTIQKNIYFASSNPESYAFRIRIKNGTQLFTLKHHVNGAIDEYEKEFTGNLDDDPDIKETLAKFDIYPPYQQLGTLTTNRAVYDDGYAELCFDINSYNGLVDYELEYEVHKDHDYQKAFDDILAKASIVYKKSWGSKYQRCLQTKKNSL